MYAKCLFCTLMADNTHTRSTLKDNILWQQTSSQQCTYGLVSGRWTPKGKIAHEVPNSCLHLQHRFTYAALGMRQDASAGLPLSLWAGIRLPERPFQSFTQRHAVFTPPCYLWAYHQDQTRGGHAPMCDAPSLSSCWLSPPAPPPPEACRLGDVSRLGEEHAGFPWGRHPCTPESPVTAPTGLHHSHQRNQTRGPRLQSRQVS